MMITDREQIENAIVGFFLGLNEATIRRAVRSEADASVLAYELTDVLLKTLEADLHEHPGLIPLWEEVNTETTEAGRIEHHAGTEMKNARVFQG